ncbi:MAG: glycosyltransferase [Calothrix sp. C42_A2020_038]|nr:glycosyltransferase [Calothrix sp. C42_A2020_038]
MNQQFELSLIVTYRNRENHLKTLIEWWKTDTAKKLYNLCEVILVEVDEAPSLWIEKEFSIQNFQYLHLVSNGIFHKTKALNFGLAHSQGKYIAPFDVDLVPISDTLLKHLRMAKLSPQLLMTGYRVMSNLAIIDFDHIPEISTNIIEDTSIAPEDKETALWKHLIRKERFGIVPLFERQRLLEIDGWDENFIGWGGEDQDIIERYLVDGRFLCRSPELVYLHLSHPPNSEWNEAHLVEENRKHYYAKMQARKS